LRGLLPTVCIVSHGALSAWPKTLKVELSISAVNGWPNGIEPSVRQCCVSAALNSSPVSE
jgi:hypothetical protein